MCDKMAISAYILKIVKNDPFLRLQMRAKEMFNRHQNQSFHSNLQSPCLYHILQSLSLLFPSCSAMFVYIMDGVDATFK